jgi:hypothetical protein
MKTAALAAVIERDLLRDNTPPSHNIIACWSCGYTFIYKGRSEELNGNFCSMRCQEWYDAGNPRHCDINKIVYRDRNGVVAMKPGRHGFHIRCPGCNKEFESKGLLCCSADCERRYRERQENLAIMAKAGIEPARKRQCTNPDCKALIPTWRKGRLVSSSTRFCSPKCAQRARRAGLAF